MSGSASAISRTPDPGPAPVQLSAANVASEIAASAPSRPRVDKARLKLFLESQPGLAAPLRLGDLHYIEDAGGSNGIAVFDMEVERRTRPFVLRYAPGEQLLKQKRFDDEFFTLKALRAHGVPAPIARWCDATGEAIGFPFLVMERLKGRAPANRMMHSTGLLAEVGPAERKAMLLQAAGFHGRLRRAALGPDAVPHLVRRGEGRTAIERELNWWLREAVLVTASGDPQRKYLIELNRWMIENQPDARLPTLCHGDGQIANLMYHDGKLVAALDWELSYLGHNEADLALVAMLIPMHVPEGVAVDGLPCEAEIVARYEAEAGAPVEHWAYFKLFNLVKVSTIMLMNGRYVDDATAEALWALNADDRKKAWAAARAEADAR
jgi:aminoglycoside phosphotransferase (APT) family kinase protein